MRLPIATTIQSRDGTLTKDSKLVNAFVETIGDETMVYQRPGLNQVFSGTDSIGRGVFCFDGEFHTVTGSNISVLSPTLVGNAAANAYPTSASRAAITYFGDDLYAISSTGAVLKSTDNGATWASSGTITTGANLLWYSAAASTNKIVVVGLDLFSNTFCTAYSENGSAWSLGSVINETANDTQVIFNGLFFCAVCGTSAMKSVDGATWTENTIALGTSWLGIANKGSYMVATSSGGGVHRISSSTDGVTWTDIAANPFSNIARISCNGDVFCIVNGGSSSTAAYTSVNGVSWTSRAFGGTFTCNEIAPVNGGFAVSLSSNNKTLLSIDGITWTQLTLSETTTWSVIASKGVSSTVAVIQKSGSFDVLNTVTFSITNSLTSTNAMSGDTNADPVSATKNGDAAATSYFMFKTTTKAYALSGTTLTPVTDVDYPAETVPGVVHLDGFFFVMKANSEIYNSALEDPLSWGALDFLSAEVEPDAAVALAKHQNYVVALKESTTELFYNAANASGSPLARLSNAAIQIGCGSGYSVANLNGCLFFISRTRARGLSVHYFPADAIQPVEIATPGIQRILNAADLTTVHCFAGKIGGHSFYVVNLVTEGITLVFDLQSQVWSQWTFLTAQSAKSITSLTQSNGVATATSTAHGYSDGDPVTIAGATPSGYNGAVNITRVDADTFTYPVSSNLSTPATGTITATGYTTGYFPFGFFASCGGVDYVQHESNGKLYEISIDYADDEGAPIDVLIRTPKLDNGNGDRKSMHGVQVVGDQLSGNLLVRYSDDDYQTFSTYRPIALTGEKAQLRRLGQFRRRAMDFRYTGSGKLRIQAIDAEIEQGR